MHRGILAKIINPSLFRLISTSISKLGLKILGIFNFSQHLEPKFKVFFFMKYLAFLQPLLTKLFDKNGCELLKDSLRSADPSLLIFAQREHVLKTFAAFYGLSSLINEIPKLLFVRLQVMACLNYMGVAFFT